MTEKMPPEKADAMMDVGYHCSQVVFQHGAIQQGMDGDQALVLAAGLGGGGFHGEMCGTVSGAILALSMKYGYSKENAEAKNDLMVEKIHEFEEKFIEAHGSLNCRDLLGYDMGKEDGPDNMETDDTYSNCKFFCKTACDLVDELLKD